MNITTQLNLLKFQSVGEEWLISNFWSGKSDQILLRGPNFSPNKINFPYKVYFLDLKANIYSRECLYILNFLQVFFFAKYR